MLDGVRDGPVEAAIEEPTVNEAAKGVGEYAVGCVEAPAGSVSMKEQETQGERRESRRMTHYSEKEVALLSFPSSFAQQVQVLRFSDRPSKPDALEVSTRDQEEAD